MNQSLKETASSPATAACIVYFASAVLLAYEQSALAAGIPGKLEEATVTAPRLGLAGEPVAARQGIVHAEQLDHRPILPTAEVLEVVPRLAVTLHSGDGKANQYLLRGSTRRTAATQQNSQS